MQISREISHVSVRPASEFTDFAYWRELAKHRLERYPLPADEDACTVEAMSRWLDRLDLTKKQFLKTGAYKSLQDFIDIHGRYLPLSAYA